MPLEIQFSFPLVNGFHARPASIFRDAANRFNSAITFRNQQNNSTANAKSTLALLSTLTKHADPCMLTIHGHDEQVAVDAMRQFIQTEFPRCDESLASASSPHPAGSVPRPLRITKELYYQGMPVSRGIVTSRAFVVQTWIDMPDLSRVAKGTVAEELARLERAFTIVSQRLREQLGATQSEIQLGILKAHLAILEDAELKAKIQDLLHRNQLGAGAAIIAAADHFAGILQHSASVYLQERVLDIRDIAVQLVNELYGKETTNVQPALEHDAVWVAENLSPSQFIALDKQRLKGIVLSQGGSTSHTVILARAFGIPCIVGISDIHRKLKTGQGIVVDAERGLVVPDPSVSVRRFYDFEIENEKDEARRLQQFIDVPATTADGRKMEVAANVGSLDEARLAFRNGAEGIGLFRTELLFMNRTQPPTEEEQFAVYSETARIAGSKRVIIRTLDVGGDKPISYLNLPTEKNPFLGFRAIRMYRDHKEIIDTQLRSILRASAFGNVMIMFPMISSVEEVRTLRDWVRSIMQDLDQKKISYNPAIEIGIMVEIPSVGLIIDQLSRHVDFFSIGSNDLTQYFLAVDRDNDRVGALYNSLAPSFLRFLKDIIDQAHAHSKWIGLCGELGGNTLAVPLFVGFGIDEISLSSPGIPKMKSAISKCESTQCKTLLASILEKETPAEVEKLLRESAVRTGDHSLVAKELIRTASRSQTKDEAIRELVHMLYRACRTDDPDQLEEAIWQREDVYSTGIGFHIAIPHCKSEHVFLNSIAVLRCSKGIDWKSLDEQPVTMVLLIAIRADAPGDEHLKMIASLSRKLMDEEFRGQLLSARDAEHIVSQLTTVLG